MKKSYLRLSEAIKNKGSLLTKDEAFDFYTDNIMKRQAQCVLTINGFRPLDYKMYQLKQKAAMWYRYALGSLLLTGSLNFLRE